MDGVTFINPAWTVFQGSENFPACAVNSLPWGSWIMSEDNEDPGMSSATGDVILWICMGLMFFAVGAMFL